jgi:predicted MPP superfamily phosphohydrolase
LRKLTQKENLTMFDFISGNWNQILIVILLIASLLVFSMVAVYFGKVMMYLWHKRVLLVDKKYLTEMSLLREKLYAEKGEIPVEQLSGLFETLSTVVDHKDRLIKATGESLKKLDNKIDSMVTTIANLEETNRELRNRESVINNLKSIKLLMALLDEIEKFASESKEQYLGFIRDNLLTVLLGFGVEPYDVEFLDSEELLKYYKISNPDASEPYQIVKNGYLVRLPEGFFVIKQALITSRGQ